MTRVFLAAGVAALAIVTPASAQPGGHERGNRVERAQQQRGDQRAQRQARPQRAERAAPRMQRAERPQRAQRMTARPQRAERQQAQSTRVERAQTRTAQRQQARPKRVERAQTRVADRRQEARTNRTKQVQSRTAQRQQVQPRAAQRQQAQNRADQRQKAQRQQAQNRAVERQKAQRQQAQNKQALDRMHERMANRQQGRDGRVQQAQNRLADRRQLRADRLAPAQTRLIERNNRRFERLDRVRAFAPVPARLTINRTRVIPVGQATRFIGAPVSRVSNFVTLAAFPRSVRYLYPDTPNYYYRYGDGYLYQVDRSTSLIAALVPLLAGGFMPGQYLPASYMNSYVPNYYGFNSFYPSSYGYDYGYGYGPTCNRYYNGVVYQVDCGTGLIDNVVPLYASGYGVGQLLPSSYSYYNVPYQYRSLYYDTPDYGYWYSPGAIYQYDRGSSLITSVAALMSPGFTIGQRLPLGYGMYNVPYGYRTTYYDTPTAWYRYNNGYIYQVDPTTQLVSAIVASVLT